MKNIISVCVLLSILIASCTKEVDLALKGADAMIVIDGNITNEAGPYFIKISKTVNFSLPNQFPPVPGALVIVSDNSGVTDTLSETIAGTYETSKLVGVPGRTYTMKVVVEGKSYEAISTMPQPVNLDSLSFDLFTSSGNTGGKEWLTLPEFSDPAGATNSYRFIQTVNGKLDKTYFVLNDNTFNGSRNVQLLFNPDAEIVSGDTVSIEFRCTDKSAYDYFFTLSQVSDGLFSATPSNPPNNIKDNPALGLFSAHTVQRKTRVVP